MIQETLKRIGRGLANLAKQRPSATVGIDIGSGSIKAVEIHWSKGKPQLTAAGIAALPENTVREGYIVDTDSLADVLERLLASSGITSKHAIVSINGQAIITRELVFPSMSTDELREAIKWDLDKYIPAADVNSYYFDFAIVGQPQAAEVKVLLVAAPLATIMTLLGVLKGLGLKPMAIDIEPLAVYRTLKDAANSIVIDIGANTCQMTIFQNGSPAVTRFIPLGGASYTEVIMRSLELEFHEAERLKIRQRGLLAKNINGEEPSYVHTQLSMLVEELGREIRRTADYYLIQNRTAVINSILLTGGGSQLDNIDVNLALQLGDTQVWLSNPLEFVTISPSLDTDWLTGIGPQLAVAIGLALRGGDND